MAILSQVSTGSGGTWSTNIVGKDENNSSYAYPTIASSSTSVPTTNPYLEFNCSSIPSGSEVTSLSVVVKASSYSSTRKAYLRLYSGTTAISDYIAVANANAAQYTLTATSIPGSFSNIRLYVGASTTSSSYRPKIFGASATVNYVPPSEKICKVEYSGRTISSATETGSVNISYNGRTIVSGLSSKKTLSCSGKYMQSNIVIGSKTLNCSGKLMSGDISAELIEPTLVLQSSNKGRVWITHDMESWEEKNIGGDAFYNILCYGGGSFIAAYYADSTSTYAIRQSTDNGKTWTSRYPGYTTWLAGMAYGNGKFVSVCNYEDSLFARRSVVSTDGTTWTSYETALPAKTSGWAMLAFFNGVFIAHTHGMKYARSSDGVTWTLIPELEEARLDRAVVVNGRILLYSTSYYTLKTSTDGITWQDWSSSSTPVPRSIVYGNGMYVAQSMDDKILTSTDGKNWTVKSTAIATPMFLTAFFRDKFYAISTLGTSMASSSDGSSWAVTTLTPAVSARNLAVCASNV